MKRILCHEYKNVCIAELDLIIKNKNCEVNKKKEEVHNIKYVEDFSNKDKSNSDLIYDLDEITNDLYTKQYKAKLLENNIAKEDAKLFKIDENVLKQLYGDANELFGNLTTSYNDFVAFHNKMCCLRKEKYKEELDIIKEQIKNIEIQLKTMRESFNMKFVDYKVDVNDKSDSLYEKYYESKMELSRINNDYILYMNSFNRIKEIEKELKEINEKKISNNANQERFNEIFVDKSFKFTNEKYYLSFNDKPNSMPISADGAQGKLGTGDTKALICALDFSFYDFFEEKSINMPFFVIHDKMENVALDKLKEIFKYVRESGVQYILPILYDRIDTLNVTDDEIILKLSKDSKLFKI